MKNKDNKKGMTVQEAGRKGGETVSEKYGPEFYSEIGQKGGKAAHEQHPDLAQRAGHEGGQKVKDLIEKGRRNESDR